MRVLLFQGVTSLRCFTPTEPLPVKQRHYFVDYMGVAQILTGGVTQVLAFVPTYRFFEPQPYTSLFPSGCGKGAFSLGLPSSGFLATARRKAPFERAAPLAPLQIDGFPFKGLRDLGRGVAKAKSSDAHGVVLS